MRCCLRSAAMLLTLVDRPARARRAAAAQARQVRTRRRARSVRVKAGTPTMGGLMFLAVDCRRWPCSLVVTRDADMLLPLCAMLAARRLGVFDDFQTLAGAQKLSGHETWFWLVKWGVLLGIGVAVAAVLYFHLDLDARARASLRRLQPRRRSTCRSSSSSSSPRPAAP